jgi:hypothetical protein
MSSSDFTTSTAASAPFNRWDIPVKMGVIIGIINMLWTTLNNMLVLPHNYIAYLVLNLVIFILMIVLYGNTGVRQRKAMGGFITLKEAFSAIFITILISTAIAAIWSVVYAKWIDPHVGEKVKEGTLAFMERMKMPQERLDEQAANFDKQLIESVQPAQLLLSYAKGIIFMSIFGFICAAIVRRAPKQAMM